MTKVASASNAWRVALGIVTFVPLAYWLFSIVVVGLLWAPGSASPLLNEVTTSDWLDLVALAVTIALIVYYVRHLLQNRAIPPDRRGLWMVTLLVLSPLALPSYFLRHVWPQASELR